MSDPKRLCDAGTPLEARLLASAMGDAPRKELGRKVQVALGIGGLAIGTGTASTSAAASKAAPFLASIGIAKWAGIVVLGTGTVVGAAVIHRQTGAPAPASVEVPTSPPRDAPRTAIDIPPPPPARPAAPSLAPPPVPVPVSVPANPTPTATATPTPTELAVELSLLDRAHAALDSGDSQLALATLDRHDLEFAHGNLAPEALALRIDAYALRHDGVKVTELGQKFLAEYPSHPEARRVSALMKATARP